MYKQEPFSHRGSLRSLRSAPLLSTVLESTLSLTRIHPIASLELPGLDYAIQSQSAIIHERRELGTSLRGIATITAGTSVQQPQQRLGPQGSVRETKRSKVPQRALSRKLKPHLVADTVKQYISRAQRPAKGSQEQQPNMEFLRGVYAFMQVDYQQGFESITTTAEVTTPLTEANATTITTTGGQTTEIPTTIRGSSMVIGKKQNQETSLSLKTTASNGLEENPKRSIAKKSLKQIKETPEEEQSQKQQQHQQEQLQQFQHKMLNKRKHQRQHQ